MVTVHIEKKQLSLLQIIIEYKWRNVYLKFHEAIANSSTSTLGLLIEKEKLLFLSR